MSTRLLKCYGPCGDKYPKDEMLQIKNVNYCRKCYSEVLKEKEDRFKLHDFIKKEFNLTFPTGLMLRQIKQFQEREYTLENILLTLEFIKYVRREKMILQYGIARVPYFIDEAIQNKKDQEMRASQNNEVKEEIKVMKLKVEDFDKNKRKNQMLINMEEL